MTRVADPLGGSHLLASLDAPTRRGLARSSVSEIVHAGDVLVRRGDVTNGVFLVVTGRLVAEDDAGAPLAEHGPGDVVGELSVLTGDRRAATVRALRDSHVVRVPTAAFDRLLRDQPEVGRRIAGDLAVRLTARPAGRAAPAAPPRARIVAMVPVGGTPAAVVTDVSRLLVAALGPRRTRRLTQEGAGRAVGHDPAPSELLGHLHRLERSANTVILQAGTDPGWATWCARQADELVLVGAADAPTFANPVEEAILVVAPGRRRRLLVVHRGERPVVGAATAWAAGRDADGILHLPLADPSASGRMARELTGSAVGIVLGGGGPRGFAHLGVVRALEEAGVPVDVVGGTSIGAVIGAGVALGWDHDTRLERAIAAFGRRRIIRPTLAGIALASSSRITTMLRDPTLFGGLDVTDVPRRFFCVSTNLTRGCAVVHDDGPLWRSLRASISIPGVLAPVFDGGDLLVDGAAVDNLPIGTMRARGVGKVIAVDVMPDADARLVSAFDADASAFRLLARRLRDRRLPGAVDVMLQAKALGGRIAQREARMAAPPDLLLAPPVDHVGMLDFRRALGLVDIGYRYASEVLAATPWGDGRT